MTVFEWEKATVDYFQSFRSYEYLNMVMHWFSDVQLAAIFGLVLFLLIGRQKTWKARGVLLFWILICVAISDPISHRLVKPFFARPRPFYLLSGCASYKCWGFVSSHATNIAAVGAFLSFLKPKSIYFFLPLFVFVALSRLYLFKHFPLDVIGGGLLGVALGTAVYLLSIRGPVTLRVKKNTGEAF